MISSQQPTRLSDQLNAAIQALDRARDLLMASPENEKLYERARALFEIEEAELSVARVKGLIEGAT